jgi:hypothetical protein
MNEQVRLLEAEVKADLQAIDQAYRALDTVTDQSPDPETTIAIAYYVHVIYGLFENLFGRIATFFGNQITDRQRWHAQLLRRMTLDVSQVRPPVIGQDLYDSLDEMRRFRHLFRNAYVLNFDPDRLSIVLKHARRAEGLHRRDIGKFIEFLTALEVSDEN